MGATVSWHDDRRIRAEISERNGEVMLSASDVVAWLRACATEVKPASDRTATAGRLADLLANEWLEAAWTYANASDS
jgi:hypothetical protein